MEAIMCLNAIENRCPDCNADRDCQQRNNVEGEDLYEPGIQCNQCGYWNPIGVKCDCKSSN